MTRPCRIGIQLPEVERRVGWDELTTMARRAEDVGFDSLWLGDHLLYDLPGIGPRGPWEVWTSLAALAMVTERVELGPLVASTAFHEPTMLAKQAATVDAISGGRLIVGLGAGWNEREFRAFGFPFDRRVDRFAEAFTIIRTLLTEGRIDFEGEFHRVDDCVIDPPPTRPGGPPLLVGSIGRRMLSLTAPHMDAWNVWWADHGNSPEGWVELNERVTAACEAVGRNPSEVTRTSAVLVQMSGGRGRVMGNDQRREVAPISGSVEEMAGRLSEFARAGVEHLQLVVDPITLESIDTLGEVLAVLDAEPG
jgi:probable F420-dependent oxidoreductase